MEDVPDSEKSPLASGVPAVGRTCIPCQVNVFGLMLLIELIVIVIAEAVTLTLVGENVPPLGVLLMLLAAVLPPFTLIVTDPAGLNWNPVGAVNMIVPVPIRPAPPLSAAIGPVSVVQEPAGVSAEMAEPPEAAVRFTCSARAIPALVMKQAAARSRVIVFFFCFIGEAVSDDIAMISFRAESCVGRKNLGDCILSILEVPGRDPAFDHHSSPHAICDNRGKPGIRSR
jgi:hypothetical protein